MPNKPLLRAASLIDRGTILMEPASVMPINHLSRGVMAAVAVMALTTFPIAAQPAPAAGESARVTAFPSSRDLSNMTTAGSYLAARHASADRDASAAAAFYRSALRTDPKNNELLDRAFIASVADGDMEEAVKLSERILVIDKTNRVIIPIRIIVKLA